MASVLFKIFSPVLKTAAKVYTSKERKFSYKDISVVVKPGVFHPGLYFSTRLLLDFVHTLDIKGKSFLELGAGTGIISILAVRRGAMASASDISHLAVKNIKLNADSNRVKINIFHSDLFKEIPHQIFNVVMINPPYFKKDPKIEKEYAWFCGSSFEYFHSLFKSLTEYINVKSEVYMILSEVCDIDVIKSIGIENGFVWNLVLQKKIWGEENFIYAISK